MPRLPYIREEDFTQGLAYGEGKNINYKYGLQPKYGKRHYPNYGEVYKGGMLPRYYYKRQAPEEKNSPRIKKFKSQAGNTYWFRSPITTTGPMPQDPNRPVLPLVRPKVKPKGTPIRPSKPRSKYETPPNRKRTPFTLSDDKPKKKPRVAARVAQTAFFDDKPKKKPLVPGVPDNFVDQWKANHGIPISKLVAPKSSFPEKDSSAIMHRKFDSPRPAFRVVKSTPSKPGRKNVKKVGATYVKGFGAANSKSAGFFKTRKRIKRRDTYGKMLKNGVTVVSETGSLLTSDYTRYIGHTTMGPINNVRVMCFLSAIKVILKKMGVQVPDMNQQLTSIPNNGFVSTDFFALSWRNSPVGGVGSQTFQLSTRSMYTMATDYAAWYESVAAKDVILYEFHFVPDGVDTSSTYARTSVQLVNSRIHFDCKSTLKLQNRSVNSTGNDQTDDVDNVPLYGKSYEGKGTGSKTLWDGYTNLASNNYIADNVHGIINYNGTDQKSQEPLDPRIVVKATKTGKAHLDPGQIKTDVLTFKGSYDFNKLLNTYMAIYTTNPTDSSLRDLGTFKFFGLEKMLEVYPYVDNVLTIVSFVIAFERNLRMTAVFKPGFQKSVQCPPLLENIVY